MRRRWTSEEIPLQGDWQPLQLHTESLVGLQDEVLLLLGELVFDWLLLVPPLKDLLVLVLFPLTLTWTVLKEKIRSGGRSDDTFDRKKGRK